MSVPGANGLTADVATDFAQFAGLRAAAQRNDPQALRQAAKQFEALFTQMMLKTSRETQFGDDLTGEQGDLYKDMYDQQMALHMASGKGMGLADMLVRQLGGLHGGGGATQTGQGATQAGSGTTAAGNSDWQPKSAQEFVDAVRPHAEKAAAELGVPARALIAQAALETGWGQHIGKAGDGSSGFNLFGIKAQSGWSGPSLSQATAEFQDGQWTTGQANFRSYGSIGAAFDDYVKFLKDNPRYADAIRSGNVQSFADGLQKAGYATDPQYAQKLLRVANSAQMAGAYNASAATA